MSPTRSAAPHEVAAAYQAAHVRSLAVRHESPGTLRLRGRDSLDFLHRMSTNALTDLEPGQIRGTVLTTAIGRTVDVVQVLSRPSDVLLLTSPGRAADVFGWLSRYVFFNDDVRIEIAAEAESSWGVYGPQAGDEIARLGLPLPAGSETFAEHGDAIVWPAARPVPGFHILAGAEAASRARSRWEESGPDLAAVEAYEAIRIEQGQPAPGREIDDQVIPLEVGLWDLVSFSKGCYIGQEVIARMESRHRVARSLVGVRLDEAALPPQDVLLDRQPIGRMTSAALSPRFGPIGLALVRGSALEAGTVGITLTPAGSGGKLQALPLNPEAG